MLFTSYIFIFFFAVAYALFRWAPLNRVLLVNAASIVFYGAWNPAFLLLLLLSSLVDFYCGRAIYEGRGRRRAVLLTSIIVNLGILGFFKYAGFLSGALSDLAWFASGRDLRLHVVDVALPVGISFYTFQTMAYTIDVYRGQLVPARRFRDFFLYVSFFPQLVAGPIERAGHILPQISRLAAGRALSLADAGDLLLRGYFKKVVVADNLAVYVDRVFGNLGAYPPPFVLLATIFFAIQIYCDFSGYSDIARGLGKLFGIDLMVNFDYPYFARDITEFWSRWHISLSTWLRDYLYIPLGGNRGSTFTTGRNLMITMLLGGLWHGANYTFLAWGAYHGALLILNRGWRSLPIRGRGLPTVAAWTITSACTLFGWYLFRIESIGDVAALFVPLSQPVPRLDLLLPDLQMLLVTAIFVAIQTYERVIRGSRVDVLRLPPAPRYATLLLLAIAYVWLRPASDQTFIYFQF